MAALTFRSGALLLTTLTVALALSSCGDDGNDKSDPADVPDGSVAVVGDREISQDDLKARVAAVRRAQPKPSKGASGKQASAQLEQQALSALLVSSAWEQEAANRGIKVSKAEVRQRWESVSSGQFKTKKALRRFLGGQTEQDLLAQLRIQTLSERIHAQIAEEAGGGKKGAKAVEEFQKEFQKRWQEQTACGKRYDTAVGCGS